MKKGDINQRRSMFRRKNEQEVLTTSDKIANKIKPVVLGVIALLIAFYLAKAYKSYHAMKQTLEQTQETGK